MFRKAMIKPENDRGVHFNKIGRLSVSDGDVDGRKV